MRTLHLITCSNGCHWESGDRHHHFTLKELILRFCDCGGEYIRVRCPKDCRIPKKKKRK